MDLTSWDMAQKDLPRSDMHRWDAPNHDRLLNGSSLYHLIRPCPTTLLASREGMTMNQWKD
eukprot:scaffold242516_cov39-Cyclotella_meneghiniana.AAC.2